LAELAEFAEFSELTELTELTELGELTESAELAELIGSGRPRPIVGKSAEYFNLLISPRRTQRARSAFFKNLCSQCSLW